jgi:hypothetical protein
MHNFSLVVLKIFRKLDRGLGILLLSTRITEGMVWSVLVWGISALFAVGLVLLKTHMINREDGIVSQALVALVGP